VISVFSTAPRPTVWPTQPPQFSRQAGYSLPGDKANKRQVGYSDVHVNEWSSTSTSHRGGFAQPYLCKIVRDRYESMWHLEVPVRYLKTSRSELCRPILILVYSRQSL
jgi:hypothetical protein